MLLWKSALAVVVLAYLIIASAISLTVHYLAMNPQSMIGRQGNVGMRIVSSIEPECPQKLSLDVSWPDEIWSYTPMQSCEEYAS